MCILDYSCMYTIDLFICIYTCTYIHNIQTLQHLAIYNHIINAYLKMHYVYVHNHQNSSKLHISFKQSTVFRGLSYISPKALIEKNPGFSGFRPARSFDGPLHLPELLDLTNSCVQGSNRFQ